jgi:hypothetical protein
MSKGSTTHFIVPLRTVGSLAISDLATKSVCVRVRVTLQLTVGQSVSLGVEPRLGLMTRYLFLYESRYSDRMGRPL